MECPWLAHDYNILCACPGLAYRRPGLAKPLWTVAECTCGIRPSGSRSRWYMCRGSIPGIPASRCGRRGRPSERGHGSTASLMELSARAGLAAPLPHYSSYRTWNVHCTSLDSHRCRNAGAAAANFPLLSLVVALDRRPPVGSRNSSARLTSALQPTSGAASRANWMYTQDLTRFLSTFSMIRCDWLHGNQASCRLRKPL